MNVHRELSNAITMSQTNTCHAHMEDSRNWLGSTRRIKGREHTLVDMHNSRRVHTMYSMYLESTVWLYIPLLMMGGVV